MLKISLSNIKNKRTWGLFLISMGIFSVLSILLSSCSIPIDKQIHHKIAQIAFAENTTIIDQEIVVAKINHNLLLVDYHNDDLCGFFGCLFSIYDQKDSYYQLLWSGYLRPHLPPHQSLFVVSDSDDSNPYPCLDFNQVETSTYKQLTYCFDGDQYQLTKSKAYL